MLEPVFITLVVIFVVYLLYQRKKRKEQQMGEELDDLIKANDWQGVSRILRKQLIIWGLLAVIATAIGIISFIHALHETTNDGFKRKRKGNKQLKNR